MCCNEHAKNNCEPSQTCHSNGCEHNNAVIIIVLYILLAIILGSCFF